MRLGMWELLLILGIVVFLFGAKRIPEMMGGVGEGIRNFKKSVRDDGSDDDNAKKVDEHKGKED